MSFIPVDASGAAESGMRLGLLNEAQEALAQAFRLQQGELTSRFNTADAIFVASTREIIPVSTPAFEDISDAVRNVLIAERQNSAALEAVNGIIDRISAGTETFGQAAAQAASPIETLPQSVTR